MVGRGKEKKEKSTANFPREIAENGSKTIFEACYFKDRIQSLESRSDNHQFCFSSFSRLRRTRDELPCYFRGLRGFVVIR